MEDNGIEILFWLKWIAYLALIEEEIPLSKFQTLTKVLERKAGKWKTKMPKPFAPKNKFYKFTPYI